MTNQLLGAIDRRISHLLEARTLLVDFVKTEKLSKHRGRRNYFGKMGETVDPGLVVARKVRRTSAIMPSKSASTKLASVTMTRTIKSASKPSQARRKPGEAKKASSRNGA
jgi:hypothetical protein